MVLILYVLMDYMLQILMLDLLEFGKENLIATSALVLLLSNCENKALILLEVLL